TKEKLSFAGRLFLYPFVPDFHAPEQEDSYLANSPIATTRKPVTAAVLAYRNFRHKKTAIEQKAVFIIYLLDDLQRRWQIFRILGFLAELQNHRNNRNDHKRNHNDLNVLLKVDAVRFKQKPVKVVACENQAERPDNRTKDIVKHKSLFFHKNNSGNNGRKGSENRKKTRQN